MMESPLKAHEVEKVVNTLENAVAGMRLFTLAGSVCRWTLTNAP